mmetsp:Transcript_9844/g.25063  ORF Transcript_9844/g.25063 Transcript_9844/m.25063 type:complete len:206 (-) Transcript_9844:76-693(-)
MKSIGRGPVPGGGALKMGMPGMDGGGGWAFTIGPLSRGGGGSWFGCCIIIIGGGGESPLLAWENMGGGPGGPGGGPVLPGGPRGGGPGGGPMLPVGPRCGGPGGGPGRLDEGTRSILPPETMGLAEPAKAPPGCGPPSLEGAIPAPRSRAMTSCVLKPCGPGIPGVGEACMKPNGGGGPMPGGCNCSGWLVVIPLGGPPKGGPCC